MILLVAVEMLEQFKAAVTLEMVLAQNKFGTRSRFTSIQRPNTYKTSITRMIINKTGHVLYSTFGLIYI